MLINQADIIICLAAKVNMQSPIANHKYEKHLIHDHCSLIYGRGENHRKLKKKVEANMYN